MIRGLSVHYSPILFLAVEEPKRSPWPNTAPSEATTSKRSWKAGGASAPRVTVIAADRFFVASQQIRSQIRSSEHRLQLGSLGFFLNREGIGGGP